MIPSISSPTYRLFSTGGLYKITLRTLSADNKNGIPVNSGSDIINLQKVSGSGPDYLTVSEYGLSINFGRVDDLIPEIPAVQGPTPTKKASK